MGKKVLAVGCGTEFADLCALGHKVMTEGTVGTF